MSNYKRINIEPKYVHEMTEFGFQQYNKYVPFSCLIEDLEYAFVGQIQSKIRHLDLVSEDRNHDLDKVAEFPLSDWKMSSIFDERGRDEKEWETEIKQRTGQAGVEEYEKLTRAGKLFEERKIARGFDIVNTWKIK